MKVLYLILSLLTTFFLNIPFGYWRFFEKRFSLGWFLAIHLPVPVVFTMRFMLSIPYYLIPIYVFFYFLGQFIGSKIAKNRLLLGKKVSKCLVMDLIKRN